MGLFGGDPTYAGIPVTPEKALSLVAVYRAVALLSGVISAMPWHAFRNDNGRRVEVPVPAVDDPHPDKTAVELREYIATCLLTHGNFYASKQRDGAGRIRYLLPYHPRDVLVRWDPGWVNDFNPSGKRFFFRGQPDDAALTPFEVLHIPGLSYNGIVGLSPIQLAKQALGLSMAAERYGAQMFDKGALVQGILQTDGQLGKDSAERQANAARIQQMWADKTVGAANHWRIPVLDAGLRFQPIQLPPEDVQLLATQEWGVEQVAALFGIPPHLLARVEKTTSWGTGIEQQQLAMLTYTIDPFLVKIEERISREVAQPTNAQVYVKFNRSALLRVDTAARFTAYNQARQMGVYNANTIRELEDMDPIAGPAGDAYWMPANMIPVREGEDIPTPAAPAAAAPGGDQ